MTEKNEIPMDRLQELELQVQIHKMVAETTEIQQKMRFYPWFFIATLIIAGSAAAKIFV